MESEGIDMATRPSFKSESKAADLNRIFIWCVPRTLSTALTKCLSYVDKIQIFFEPYISAFYFDPEKPNVAIAKCMDSVYANQQTMFEHALDGSKCTYGWIRQQLEAEYPGKNILLVKDHAHGLNEKYDIIPAGFRHTFLIRHPYKVYPSWKLMRTEFLGMNYDTTTWNDLESSVFDHRNAYEMQFELFRYVQEHFDHNPVIIDADDLQSNPSSILRQLCQSVGIPYDDRLLEWPAGDDIVKTWKDARCVLPEDLFENKGGHVYMKYESALRSERFLPVTPTPKRSELSDDIKEVSDYSMPFYDKMYQMRVKPEKM